MYTLSPLPYGFDALEPFIDKTTMEIHHDKHHAAYIKNLNDALSSIEGYTDLSIDALLQSLSSIPEAVRTKVKNNAGGHSNHSMFWTIMGPPSGQMPEGQLMKAIEHEFGGVGVLQTKVSDVALAHFGSGWAWLVVDGGKLKVVDTSNQDSPITQHMKPILGIDVWEHAYYLMYQNKRAEYIKAFWNVVNWREVEKLYASAISSV